MLLIGLIFALAAALWLACMLQRGGPLTGCLLVVLCGSCLGHPFFHLSILTLDRALWALVCGLYVWQRGRQGLDLRGLTVADLLVLGLLAVLGLSTLSHDWRYEEAQPVSRWLFLYLMPAGLYWIARHTPVSVTAMRNLAIGCALFGLYLALTAIAEAAGRHGLVFPRYIVSTEFPEFLGRGRGPFLNPSANGIYMGTCLAGLVALVPQSTPRQRIGLGLLALILLAGGLATLTRCVWLGMILSMLLLLWLNLPFRKSIGVTFLVGSLAVMVLAVGWQNLVAFKRDKNVSVSEMKESAKLRPMLAAVAWQIFCEHPIAGVGFGQYKQADQGAIAQRTRDLPLDKVRPYHQHNVVLSLLTETGLLGTLPYLALLGVWSRTAMQLWRRIDIPWWLRQTSLLYLVCLTNYLANGMFQDVALIPLVNSLLFLVAGLLMSVAKQAQVVSSVRWPATACHARVATARS